MAKRAAAKRGGRAQTGRTGRKRSTGRGSATRPKTRKAASAKRRASTRKTAAKPRSTTKPLGAAPRAGRGTKTKAARLDRARRRLEETVPTPPSSLDMKRRGSAARTGRRELDESLHEHTGMTPALTGGDVDADWENAYFSGEEAPGGDNPTPDQDIVEDIGKSLGVEYADNEELKSSDKVTERDKHRWELDPASSEDYKERK